VVGPLQRQAIVLALQRAMNRCLGLRSGGVRGLVWLNVTIGANGKVQKLKMTSTSLTVPAVKKCLIQAVKGAKFPTTKRATKVRFAIRVQF